MRQARDSRDDSLAPIVPAGMRHARERGGGFKSRAWTTVLSMVTIRARICDHLVRNWGDALCAYCIQRAIGHIGLISSILRAVRGRQENGPDWAQRLPEM